MTLPSPIACFACLVSVSLAGCAGSEPAPEPTPVVNAPGVELDSPNVSGTPTSAAVDGIPAPVYASQEELEELFAGQITEENFDDFLDQIEAELEAEASTGPD